MVDDSVTVDKKVLTNRWVFTKKEGEFTKPDLLFEALNRFMVLIIKKPLAQW